jgi:hypothetical protein
MWRLLAAWFRGDDAGQRWPATIVEDLGRHWRSLLAQALQRTLGGDPDETSAVRRLVQLPASRLPAVDDALRRESWHRRAAPPPRAPVSVAGALDADEAAACLFVAACNANGFVRQRALEELRHAPGPIPLVAALIRCDDWVPQVRLAAEALLRALMATPDGPTPLDQLDLVVALRERKRFAAGAWQSLVQPSLLARERGEMRWQWTTRGGWQVRRFALELVVQADPGQLRASASQALSDHAAPVAAWGLSKLAALPEAEAIGMLQAAARHPSASLRAAAIRRAIHSSDAVAKPLLTAAMFDRARSPRSAAAFELQRRFGVVAADAWRAALAEEPGRRRTAALLGLCDAPSPGDVNTLVAELGHRNAFIRAAVLRGLWHCQGTGLGDHLHRALHDPSKAVVRQALELLSRGPEYLDTDALEQAIRGAPAATRRLLLAATRRLPKWDALDLLLRLALDGDPGDAGLTEEARRWLQTAGLRFTSAAPRVLASLRTNVARIQGRGGNEVWRSLAEVISSTR